MKYRVQFRGRFGGGWKSKLEPLDGFLRSQWIYQEQDIRFLLLDKNRSQCVDEKGKLLSKEHILSAINEIEEEFKIELITPEKCKEYLAKNPQGRFRELAIAAIPPPRYDVTIFHVREDYSPFVKLLAEELYKQSCDIYANGFHINCYILMPINNSLWKAIKHDLAVSRYSIVVLSSDFFKKHWLPDDLQSLASFHTRENNAIFTLRYGISQKDIEMISIAFSDLTTFDSALPIEDIAADILKSMS